MPFKTAQAFKSSSEAVKGPETELKTAPMDTRFPNQNQTR